MNDRSRKQPDPRSPLVLDTRDLPRRPGAMRAVERTISAPEDLGLALIGVPEGAAVRLDLRLEAVSEGVLVSGTVAAPIEGECGRCLRPIRDTLSVHLQELYAYENSTTEETTDEEEVGRMQGDLIDLEPALRDAVVLTLPNHPLCRADCPGLCPDCGVHWDDLPEGHTHAEVDPRWSALSKLAGPEAGPGRQAGKEEE